MAHLTGQGDLIPDCRTWRLAEAAKEENDMNAAPRLEIGEVFGDGRQVEASGGRYTVPQGWYPVLGLPGSLDIAANTVLFCTLHASIEARARTSCLNGVIAGLRIHRSARVNAPDTMQVYASDLVREFVLCRVPLVADAAEFAACLARTGTTGAAA